MPKTAPKTSQQRPSRCRRDSSVSQQSAGSAKTDREAVDGGGNGELGMTDYLKANKKHASQAQTFNLHKKFAISRW